MIVSNDGIKNNAQHPNARNPILFLYQIWLMVCSVTWGLIVIKKDALIIKDKGWNTIMLYIIYQNANLSNKIVH